MLRVKSTDTKSWLFNYYYPITKKRKNLSLGLYPVLSLTEARNTFLFIASNWFEIKKIKVASTTSKSLWRYL